MSNRWVEHVRKFAKDNNMTYMCAISEASKTYNKTKDDELKSTPKKTTKAIPKEKKDNKNLKFELGTLEKFKRDEDVILDKDPILKRNYLLAFQKNYFTTRDKAFEDLRSKMIDFCEKTNNDKDCHEKFYDDIDDLFRKDLKQYIDRVYNAYLSLLRYVEEFFDKYNGKYSKETITSSKRAKELYDKIVDYFPNNTYVTELGKKLNQKSTPKMTPKAIPKEQDDKKYIRLIEEYLEKYDNSNLKKQITGNTFADRKQKALVIVEELDKDAIEINDLKNKMMSDDIIDIMDFIQNNNASFSKFLKRQPKSVGNYIKKLVQQKTK